MVRAVLNGDLEGVPTRRDEIFGLHVPEGVPGVDSRVLRPKDTWQDADAYDRQARKLAAMFAENFDRNFAAGVSTSIAAAGPQPQ
jgi:phosphoenolpyruvate carboxykinase (ATP)